jgi:hypothetical protein
VTFLIFTINIHPASEKKEIMSKKEMQGAGSKGLGAGRPENGDRKTENGKRRTENGKRKMRDDGTRG